MSASGEESDAPIINQRQEGGLVGRYTTVLFVMAGLAVMAIPSHQMSIEMVRSQDNPGMMIAVMRYLQTIEVILAVFCITAAVLRVRNSPLAQPVTAAASIFLIPWMPFGTITFFYWLLSVRKREANLHRSRY